MAGISVYSNIVVGVVIFANVMWLVLLVWLVRFGLPVLTNGTGTKIHDVVDFLRIEGKLELGQ